MPHALSDEPAGRTSDPLLLFTPLRIRGVTIRNRIGVSPMCQYLSEDGAPTDWHLVNLGRYAIGGAGIVFGEETAVEPGGRKTYACAGIWDDAHVPLYRRINAFLKTHGAVPAIQLGHSGAKAANHGAQRDWEPITRETALPGMPPWQGIAPSPVPDSPGHSLPREMDRNDIRFVIGAFVEAAKRSLDAGFEIIEIHGAHGYLIHQFLSPLRNLRTDGYGGDREGRMRFALEIAEAVRGAIADDVPLFFRVSAVDGRGGLWDIEDSIALSKELRLHGVDVVDCSSGGISGDSPMPILPRVPGYQVEYARRIRQEAGIATAAVGLITEPHHAERILAEGSADIILLARELMYNADWPAHAAKALNVGNWHDLFPPEFAHRLKRRELVSAMAINQPGGPLRDEDMRLIEST
ncbi:MAG: NADH:flavin oxidoreductase/NADH oxidase [Gemmobacter sp.]|jgi:2,4-dienoyl-CoA reductase-like NADH-dependent reductase (Old Yellow Enzyme family)|nr:NADH:flavin oxidoreductase/NADH oxidase [Gemmobacter sp.]